MKIKLLLTILLLAETITANAQNAEKEYLKKVLTNLEKIESATYYVTNESWQPGDSTALSTLHGFVKEYDNPMDSTIGASYVSLDANDTTKLEFCYDGKRIRLRTENPADKRPEDGNFILRLNGRNRDCRKKDPLTGKEKAFLPREELLPENFIEVIF